jgi:Phage Mu protein F like protein
MPGAVRCGSGWRRDPTTSGSNLPTVPIDRIRDALAANRQQALDVASSTGRRALLRVLRQSGGALARRLHQAEGLRGKGAETFTEARMRASLAQVREVVRGLEDDLRDVLSDRAGEVAHKAGEGALGYLKAAEQAFRGVGSSPLALNEAMMLDAAAQGAKASLLRRLGTQGDPGVLARYGEATVGEFERVLQQGVAQGKSTAEVRGELIEASPFLQGAPASWAERIARTELHGASNRAAHETHKAAQRELGDVVRIVSATFDDRTSWDSYNVHGEVRRVSEPFEYVTYDGEHELFLTPPNRPNDREIVVAHRLSWPVPQQLRPKGTGEVHARAVRDGLKKFPGRPRVMSTIPASRFG